MNPEQWKVAAAVAACIGLIVLITRLRVHAFLALALASIALGLVCGIAPDQVIGSFEKGFGDVAGHIGVIVALGVILGGLLVSSGGVDRLAERLLRSGGAKYIPWTIGLAALLIGLPLFFEVGLVLLTPIALALARKAGIHPLRAGIPMLAGLIAAHGLLPPHPAPTIAVQAYGADPGKTILYGLVVALPALALAGPLLSSFLFRHFPGLLVITESSTAPTLTETSADAPPLAIPRLSHTCIVILLPPGLMLLRSASQLVSPNTAGLTKAFGLIGDPVMALLIAVIFASITLGFMLGRPLSFLQEMAGRNLAAAAGVILITGAGGGLKQILIDTGIGTTIVNWALAAHIAPLVLAWLAAAVLRVTIGTSTVATIMASGLIAPLVARNPSINKELMVLATGCGSIFCSHVNDPGFWFIKQYFGLSLKTTFGVWTVLTTLLSLTGLLAVLLLNVVF